MYVEIVKKSVGNMPIHVSPGKILTSTIKIADIHYHDEDEVLMVTEGEMRVDIFDHPLFLMPGDILLLNSRTPHATYTRKNGTCSHLLQFDMNYLRGEHPLSKHQTLHLFLNNSFGDYLYLKNDSPIGREIAPIINSIVAEQEKKQKGYDLAIKGLLTLFISRLQRENLLSPFPVYDFASLFRIMPAIEYMDQHYTTLLSLEEISQSVSITPYYFCRLFKQATGQTVFQYLNFLRVTEAEKILSHQECSITEVANTVGFSDVRYFNRIFKKLKNCTPSQYRKFKYAKI